jgi:hypothetical protein
MTGVLGALVGYPANAAPPISVSISDQTCSDSVFGAATAFYQVNNAGTIKNQNGSVLETWLLGGGTASNYDVRATLISGVLSSGTTGSWINCGTTSTWSVQNSAHNNSVKTAVILIEIRLTSSGVVQDSANITISAESDNYS